MKPKTKEELEAEIAKLTERITRLEKECIDENRVIRLLLAADLVTEEKVEQARDLARSLL